MKTAILSLLLLFSITAFSQVSIVNLVSQYGNTVDTVTNAATNYLVLPSAVSGKAYYRTVFVTFKATEISGTTAGTATLQVSANGTDFADVGSAFTLTDVATQTTSFTAFTSGWYGYKLRIKVTGTGTMSDKIYGAAVFKN